jgi:hypothetical protein
MSLRLTNVATYSIRISPFRELNREDDCRGSVDETATLEMVRRGRKVEEKVEEDIRLVLSPAEAQKIHFASCHFGIVR